MSQNDSNYSHSSLSPAELIMARSDALQANDYRFIYDSYHPSSNFRQQFATCEEYVNFGNSSLKKDFQVVQCEVLVESVNRPYAQVIFLVEMLFQGQVQIYAELAWFVYEDNIWYYLRGQRMEEDQLPRDGHHPDFEDFEKIEPKIIF